MEAGHFAYPTRNWQQGATSIHSASLAVNVNNTPAPRAAAPLERPASTARRLAAASLSPNTRRAYAGALRRIDAWLDGRALDDVTLALYLAGLHDAGRASASAAIAVAAAAASSATRWPPGAAASTP